MVSLPNAGGKPMPSLPSLKACWPVQEWEEHRARWGRKERAQFELCVRGPGDPWEPKLDRLYFSTEAPPPEFGYWYITVPFSRYLQPWMPTMQREEWRASTPAGWYLAGVAQG